MKDFKDKKKPSIVEEMLMYSTSNTVTKQGVLQSVQHVKPNTHKKDKRVNINK